MLNQIKHSRHDVEELNQKGLAGVIGRNEKIVEEEDSFGFSLKVSRLVYFVNESVKHPGALLVYQISLNVKDL